MISRLSRYNSSLLNCRSRADASRDINTRQIWLEIATSYELLIRLEEHRLTPRQALHRDDAIH
jgi:hypothetical protein